jgi:hypothetical protein
MIISVVTSYLSWLYDMRGFQNGDLLVYEILYSVTSALDKLIASVLRV